MKTKSLLLSASPWKSAIYHPTISCEDIVGSVSKAQTVRIIKAKWLRSCIWEQPFLRCCLCSNQAQHFGEVARLLCTNCLPRCGSAGCFCGVTPFGSSLPPILRKILIIGSLHGTAFPFALEMLRSGCEVILSSKFPQSLENALLEEPDHEKWVHRAAVLGLDLLDDESLDQFLSYLRQPRNQMFDQVFYNVSVEQLPENSPIKPSRRLLVKQFGSASSPIQSPCSRLMQWRTLAFTVPTLIARELDRFSQGEKRSLSPKLPLQIIYPSVSLHQEREMLEYCHNQLTAIIPSFPFLHLKISNLLFQTHLQQMTISCKNNKDAENLIDHFTELNFCENAIDVNTDQLFSLFCHLKMPKIDSTLID